MSCGPLISPSRFVGVGTLRIWGPYSNLLGSSSRQASASSSSRAKHILGPASHRFAHYEHRPLPPNPWNSEVRSTPPESLLQTLLRTAYSKAEKAIYFSKPARPFPHRAPPTRSVPLVRSHRPSPRDPPTYVVIWAIMGLNLAVFLAWQYAHYSWDKDKDPGPLIFMYRNFLSGLANLTEGRPWTLLTSCFSHEDMGHFLLNMISFAFMAPPVLSFVGYRTFLSLYLGAGIVAAGASIAWRMYIMPRLDSTSRYKRPDSSHGASGSIYAVMTVFALLSPNTKFLLFFIAPIPAKYCVPGIFAYDLYSSLTNPGRKTDGAGHMGGAIAGYFFWRYRLQGVRFL